MGEEQESKSRVNVAEAAQKLALTVVEAAALTSIGEETIRRALRTGELRSRMIGRDYHILPDDLKAWLDSLPDAQQQRKLRVVQTQGARRRS